MNMFREIVSGRGGDEGVSGPSMRFPKNQNATCRRNEVGSKRWRCFEIVVLSSGTFHPIRQSLSPLALSSAEHPGMTGTNAYAQAPRIRTPPMRLNPEDTSSSGAANIILPMAGPTTLGRKDCSS